MKPIIFSGPMVRAILEGRKTMTRRVVKPQHLEMLEAAAAVGECSPLSYPDNDWEYIAGLCPYGEPSDRLWVREAWAIHDAGSRVPVSAKAWPSGFPVKRLRYCATDKPPQPDYWWNRRSPIYMPRWASRITLEITDVRVERLQDISEEDAIAEGIEYTPHQALPSDVFSGLWESINGPSSWDANPWVWAITFKRIEMVEPTE